ncbi:MAG: Fic family protein [Bacteroidales bacterium]|nr:Fic family protein [Candidatus Scybalocola fimicaballi]
MTYKQLYIDFDQYIRQGEPEQKDKAYAWSTAIGLQAVDGLSTSEYLQQTAKRNIEGEISIDEARELIKNYYITKTAHDDDDADVEEADRVSANIAKLLSTNTLAFSVFGYTQVHRNIFDGVFKFAGKIRDYDITKKEWILHGDTVMYMYAQDLRLALEYDIEQERQFNYGDLSSDEIIKHISKFTAGLWQIHAFGEGNTRTTAVFVILYLRSLGFNVNNEIFAQNSWYFRNALVRYVYKNRDGVMPEPKYLERFFRNMLLGEKWVLKNRYLILDPPEEYKEQPRLDTPTSTPISTPTSVDNCNQFFSDNEMIKRLVKAIGVGQMSVKEILSAVGLKDRKNFLEYSLAPAITEGWVRMLYPDSPRHPRQKYLLTVKGVGLYDKLK